MTRLEDYIFDAVRNAVDDQAESDMRLTDEEIQKYVDEAISEIQKNLIAHD